MTQRLSTCSLMQKQIVNVCDGTNLGCASDFEVDLCDGRLTAIIVGRPSGFLWLSHERDIVIPWCKIECVGEDTILVKLSQSECCDDRKNKKNKLF